MPLLMQQQAVMMQQQAVVMQQQAVMMHQQALDMCSMTMSGSGGMYWAFTSKGRKGCSGLEPLFP